MGLPGPLGQGGNQSTGVRGRFRVGPGTNWLSSGIGLTKTGQQLIFLHESQVGLFLSNLVSPAPVALCLEEFEPNVRLQS